jgi:hypothetical protein
MSYFYKIVEGKVWLAEHTAENFPGGAEGAIELNMPNGVPDGDADWSAEAKAILDTPVLSAMDIMRNQRDILLKHSEEENPGTGMADRPWSDAWVTYRQALRDITDTQTPAHDGTTGHIKNVTWPTKPSS